MAGIRRTVTSDRLPDRPAKEGGQEFRAKNPCGYSGTPLAKKLGLKPGCRLTLLGAPANYRQLIAPAPEGMVISCRVSKRTDVAHIFTTSRSGLTATLVRLRKLMNPDAVVWVSWPKKASGVTSDVTEDTVREVCLPLGFVDVKVCEVDATWSGLKLVVRKVLR